MAQRERIVFRKIYVGKFVLFGLLFGIIVGAFWALISFILIMFSGTFAFTESLPVSVIETSMAGIVALAVFIWSVISCVIGSLVFALLYNLISKIGVPWHWDLEEYHEKPELASV